MFQQFPEFVQVLLEAIWGDFIYVLQKFQRFDHRQISPEGCSLSENSANFADIILAFLPGDMPVDPHFTTSRHQQTGKHLDGGGFTCAVGSQVADQLTGMDLKTDLINSTH